MAVPNKCAMGNPVPVSELGNYFVFDLSAKKSVGFTPGLLNWSKKWRWAIHKSGKKLRDFNHSCRCSLSNSSSWDWNQWTRHFTDIEQAESFGSVLKVCLFLVPFSVSMRSSVRERWIRCGFYFC